MKTKSRSFRYGYNAGDLVSSALSGWLLAVLFYMFFSLASGEGLEGLLSKVQTYTRDYATIALFAAVTVFFAEKCDVDSFAAAVKAHRSLGVRNAQHEQYLIFGPSRLMKYQQFLERAYWPGHDALCRKQGDLLLKRAEGDLSVQPEIEKLAAEIAAYREACFAPVK